MRGRDRGGEDAARLLIGGDVTGALAAARVARTSRSALARSDADAVLAWAHLIAGDRAAAEAAASLVRRTRTPDPLLTVALVVASGGPSLGAARAYARTSGVLSIAGATRVFVDRGRLADVRTEIAAAPERLERAALPLLQVGLVAIHRDGDVEAVGDRLEELGHPPVRYVTVASLLGGQALDELAIDYVRLAADRGYADLSAVLEDPNLAMARAMPGFAPILDRIRANAALDSALRER
jgi:hypothetical protein